MNDNHENLKDVVCINLWVSVLKIYFLSVKLIP
jgi:hypothetical protein